MSLVRSDAERSIVWVLLLLCTWSMWVWSCDPAAPGDEPLVDAGLTESMPQEKASSNEKVGVEVLPTERLPDKMTADIPVGKEPSPPEQSSDLDLVMKASDFGCILKWDKVDRYRITNLLGFQKQALAIARSKDGGVFPVGTVIQLVPQEAMVKRRKGWNPKTKDWEFFFLKVDKNGTQIVSRGKEEVKNQFGGNCFSCHNKAEEKWDLICGENHGCDPLPLSPTVLENIQNADPRCP